MLPVFGLAQTDTLPAVIEFKQGFYTKRVVGYVVLTRDCEVVEYLRVNTWKRKEQLKKFRQKGTGHVLINKEHGKRITLRTSL